MGPFGDKKNKSWQRLSFAKRATRAERLARDESASERFARILAGVLFAVGLSLLVSAEPGSGAKLDVLPWASALGLITIVHFCMFLMVRAYHRDLIVHTKRFYQYFLLLGFFFCVCKFMMWQSEAFLLSLLPLPVLATILALVYSAPLAISSTLACIAVLALMRGIGATPLEAASSELTIGTMVLSAALFLGSLIMVLGARRIRNRTRLVVVGFASGLAQFAVLAIFLLREGLPTDFESSVMFLSYPLLGFINGLGAGVIVTSALPYVERMFDVTTDIRLIELADQNNPLLREFSLLAPGSFMHSLMVGQLAEEAALSIRANDLLARVGAYYHDIGKMQKPNYFVENVRDGENVHEKLSPELSRLIIISHVKDGIRIAQEEKLPKKIIDMIPMHHGTSVVEYFYHKKRQQEETDGMPESGQEAFQYPGPKPTFREAGILMLADTTEAISRVLEEPTATRLRQVVRDVIQKKLVTGQLDECELTMRDLKRIEDAFVRVLAAIHHGRIKYPGDPPTNSGKDSEAKDTRGDDAEKGAAGQPRVGEKAVSKEKAEKAGKKTEAAKGAAADRRGRDADATGGNSDTEHAVVSPTTSGKNN